MAFSKNGDLYFTDPPYGLPLRENDPGFANHGYGGVYRIRKETLDTARAVEEAAPEPELVESSE